MSTKRPTTNYDKLLGYNFDNSYNITDKPTVWVPDQEKGYVLGEVLSGKGTGKLKLKLGSGEQIDAEEKNVSDANPGKFDGVSDMSDLSHLNEASVFHNLRKRYENDLIHTYSGLFLVVINPYKWLQIYTEEIITIYQGKRRKEVHPHVYALADEAYRNMLTDRRNQSMLITGESGAGKTENTKKVIQYIATIAGRKGGVGKLEQQFLKLTLCWKHSVMQRPTRMITLLVSVNSFVSNSIKEESLLVPLSNPTCSKNQELLGKVKVKETSTSSTN
jgi:myosin protein heavy chain